LGLLLAAGFLAITIPASAQENQEEPPAAEDRLRAAESQMMLGEEAAGTSGAGPSIWNVVQMLLTLAVVAAAIYGIVFFLKKSSKKTASKDPFLKLLASEHLGSNRYAHIVCVGEKAWLLGSSDGGVNLIGEIEDKDIINAMLLEDSRKAESPSGKMQDFVAMLRRFGLPSENKAPGAEEIRKRRERLKGM
jgi:flagellar protein FliO/FliZ